MHPANTMNQGKRKNCYTLVCCAAVCTCVHLLPSPLYERASTKKQEGFYSVLLCPQAITSCTLDPEQGGYVISVETPVPLDLVLLHSQVHMDLLESNDQDDLGQASLERVPLLVLTEELLYPSIALCNQLSSSATAQRKRSSMKNFRRLTSWTFTSGRPCPSNCTSFAIRQCAA